MKKLLDAWDINLPAAIVPAEIVEGGWFL